MAKGSDKKVDPQAAISRAINRRMKSTNGDDEKFNRAAGSYSRSAGGSGRRGLVDFGRRGGSANGASRSGGGFSVHSGGFKGGKPPRVKGGFSANQGDIAKAAKNRAGGRPRPGRATPFAKGAARPAPRK